MQPKSQTLGRPAVSNSLGAGRLVEDFPPIIHFKTCNNPLKQDQKGSRLCGSFAGAGGLPSRYTLPMPPWDPISLLSSGDDRPSPPISIQMTTTAIYSHSQGPRSPKSRPGDAELPPDALGEGPSCLLQVLGAPGTPRLVVMSLLFLPPRSHGFSPVHLPNSQIPQISQIPSS